MITERLMKPGQFDLNLRTDAPFAVWSQVQEFDHIVITPTYLKPVSAFSDANILSTAIYTGVVTGRPNPTSFAGQGLGYWLGTDQGLGDILDSAVSNTAGTLSTWVTSLLPSSLTAGTVTNTGNTLTYTYQWVTRREAIDHMCRSVGAEYRIKPNGTFDAAAPTSLFVTTPTVVITKHPEGSEGATRGLETVEVNQSRDVEGYTTKVINVGDGLTTGTATGSNVYKDLLKNNVVLERLVNSPKEASGSLTAHAAKVLALYGSIRQSVTLSSDTYAVPVWVRPGDYVWLYDERAGLVDPANQIVWRGELISPVKLRTKSYIWPVTKGMGVYARRSGATPVYTDLTEYVEWEDGAVRWEIGTSVDDPDQDPTQLSPGYLGVNGQILNRAGTGSGVAGLRFPSRRAPRQDRRLHESRIGRTCSGRCGSVAAQRRRADRLALRTRPSVRVRPGCSTTGRERCPVVPGLGNRHRFGSEHLVCRRPR